MLHLSQTINDNQKVENLTSKGYELLFARMGANPLKSGEEYEILRLKLEKYFTRQDRGRWNTDYAALADETLDRVAKRLEKGVEIEKNIHTFAYGIAKFVWLEFIRKNPLPVDFTTVPENSYKTNSADEDAEDARLACLRTCLVETCKDNDERKILLDYYRQADNMLKEQRKLIAERLQITTNTLKTRMSRLREKMEKCIINCMKKHTLGVTK